MGSFVVYTGLFGSDEQLQELPFLPSGDVDYICLTDRKDLESSSWNVQKVPGIIPGDPARTTRFYKFLGSEHIRSYDYCLWADNKVVFSSEPLELFLLAQSAGDFGVAEHDHRKTVADEFEAVLRLGKDHPFPVEATRLFLESVRPSTLSEKPLSGTILLRANGPEVFRAMEQWWTLVLRFSARDQLTLNYVISQSNLRVFKLPISATGSDLHTYLTAGQVGRKNNRVQLANFPSLLQVLAGLMKRTLLPRFLWTRFEI